MKPVEFKPMNTVFAETQPQYQRLPAHVDLEDGCVTTCWKLTWKERFKLLFSGTLWLQQLAFHKPLQPQRPCVEKPPMRPMPVTDRD